MNPRKKLGIVFIVSLLLYISGVIGLYSEELGICGENSVCANNLFYAYGRPIIHLFSLIVPFTFFLLFFSKQTVKYWLPRILWALPLPFIFTFGTPMNCSGFLGCIPDREWMSWASGILYVGILTICIALHALVLWRRQEKNPPQ